MAGDLVLDCASRQVYNVSDIMAPCEHGAWGGGSPARKPYVYGLLRASGRCTSALRVSDDSGDPLRAVYGAHPSSQGRGPVEHQHRREE